MQKVFQGVLKKMSVYQQIVTVLIVAFMIFAIYSGLAVPKVLYDIIAQQIYDDTQSMLEASQLNLVSLIHQTTATVVSIAKDEGIKECLKEEAQTQADNIRKMNNIGSIMSRYSNVIMNTDARICMVGADGMVYSNWQMQTDDIQENLRKRFDQYVDRIEKKQASLLTMDWILEPNIDEKDRMMVSLTLPILDDTEILGIVTLMISETEIQNMIQSLDTDTHTVYLIDDKMNIIASTDFNQSGTSFSEIAMIRMPVAPSGRIYLNDTSERILTYQHLKKFGWVLVDVVCACTIEREVNKVVQTLLMGMIVCVVISLALGLLLAKSITNPLTQLTQKMVELVRADTHTTRKPESNIKNEVVALQAGFEIMQGELDELIAKNIRIEREKRATEIKALQSQIRPHFLFNTLNTIRMAILNRKNDKAAEMIYELSSFLRMTIVKGEELIPLREELSSVMHYVHIIQLRHRIDFTVETEIDPSLEQLKVPNLLLQPLVENSIIHGFEYLEANGVIRIIAVPQERFSVIKVMDNGQGFLENACEEKKSEQSSGIGMENVEQRLKLYFGKKSKLLFQRIDDTWTSVELWIPNQGDEK